MKYCSRANLRPKPRHVLAHRDAREDFDKRNSLGGKINYLLQEGRREVRETRIEILKGTSLI